MSEFDKIIGYDSVKTELKMICDIIIHAEKYKKLGVDIPNGLILSGVPGVGKTLMANCFINESKRNFYICRKNKCSASFIDHIKSTFDVAKQNTPSIILLDDLDKFANEDKEHNDTDEYVTIQSCIDEVKEHDVFVIATANELLKIPDSLIRAGRFDISIYINRPNNDDEVKIISHYLSKKHFVDNIDCKEIARILDGRSCAELETIINQAGIYAGYQNKEKIEFEDIIHACKRSIYESPETIRNESNKCDIYTIYHEAGHAIVSEILEPYSVTMVSADENDGNIGGFTGYFRKDNYWQSIELMKNRICTLLAGKCAIEVKFGKFDAGSYSDIDRAVGVISRMVKEYCELGFDKIYLGINSSNEQKRNQETTITNELNKYYNQTKEIIVNNIQFLDAIANKLSIKKTLITSDIQEIKKQVGIRYAK